MNDALADRSTASRQEGWSYWRPPARASLELGTVRGRQVALPPHFHDEDQLTFVVAGRRRVVIAGVVHAAGAGQALHIPAGTVHRSLAEDADVLCVNMYLAPGEYAVRALVAELIRAWRHRSGLPWKALGAIAESHRSSEASARPPDLTAGAGTGLSILGAASVQAAASEAGVSREHFSRQFHARYGVPPATYRLLRRLNDARQRLKSGEAIAAAAHVAGFADQSHLSRYFKRHFGVAPGRYLQPPTSHPF